MQTLLIAADSRPLVQALKGALPQYRVQACRTGPQALALLEKLRPDALVIALHLPETDGLTVLRQTKFRPLYILALTNFCNDQVRQEATALGVRDLFLVPCSVYDVLARLEEAAGAQQV